MGFWWRVLLVTPLFAVIAISFALSGPAIGLTVSAAMIPCFQTIFKPWL